MPSPGSSTVAGIGGTIAAQLNTAARSAHRTYWVLLGFGIVLTPWAGRGLINVLTACAAGAWRINRHDARTSLRSIGAVIALLTLMLVMTFTLNEVRAAAGIVASTAGLMATAVVLGTGWFAVTWSLPRGTARSRSPAPGCRARRRGHGCAPVVHAVLPARQGSRDLLR